MDQNVKAELLEQFKSKYGSEVGQQLFDDLEAAGGNIRKERAAAVKATEAVQQSSKLSNNQLAYAD